MELNQKKYSFVTKENSKYLLHENQNYNVVINGQVSELDMKQLFSKFNNISDGVIKGYSLLETMGQNDDGHLTVIDFGGEILNISFYNPKTLDTFYIKRINDPLFIDDEIDITDAEVDNIATSIISENQRLSKSGEVINQPVVSSPASDTVTEPSDYIEDREQMTKKGYDELKFNEYRLLRKQGQRPVLVKLNKTSYDEIDINKTSKENEFSFENDGTKKTVKITDNELIVE